LHMQTILSEPKKETNLLDGAFSPERKSPRNFMLYGYVKPIARPKTNEVKVVVGRNLC
jgi:hypothetical protein